MRTRARARARRCATGLAPTSTIRALPRGVEVGERARSLRPTASPATQRASPPSSSRFQIGACALIAVDDLARAREGLLAVGGGGGDDDPRLAERDAADAVLGGRGLEPVALDRTRRRSRAIRSSAISR